MMRILLLLAVALLLASTALAVPGDVIRGQSLSGQPANGVRGLARDWDTGRVWVAGPQGTGAIIYTSMDAATMTPDAWIPTAGMYWVFDIACGFDYNTMTNCLLMNDQSSPFTRIIEPTSGALLGNLPDYYTAGEYTDGAAVNWDNNTVILSSYGNTNVVSYDGSSYTTFATIPGALNMGVAIGWGHVFILRTSTFYTIEVYLLDGTFVESIPLNSWPGGNYVIGLACGQENIVGDNESLFFASFITNQVYEVEVGDYNPSSLEQSTWGAIKAGFR
jgi:hypothetical protein